MHRYRRKGASHAIGTICALAIAGGLWLAAAPAHALPAFARQYGTSCTTCHTVYPRLTPFGEAFRRNGYRFPGTNSDFLKQEPVKLGADVYKKLFPNSVWPATVAQGAPFALQVVGQAVLHPEKKSSARAADNGTVFTLQDLASEAGIFAAGPIDDQITYFAEISVSEDGADFEHGSFQFGDIIGPKHAVNLMVGKFLPTLTNFGPHGSYLEDMRWVMASLTELYGGSDGNWDPMDNTVGAEVNGVLWGWVDYALGINTGSNIDVRNTQNVYGMIGGKIGGMRLDGEPGGAPVDAQHPWAQNALTFDLFAEHSASHFANPDATSADGTWNDHAWLFGGDLRAQWGSLTLDSGARQEWHDHAQANGAGANMFVNFDELSYVVFPWLVPVLRFEYLRLDPSGSKAVSDYRIIPGIAALVRPNLKVTLEATFEGAKGAPFTPTNTLDWGPSGGFAAPATPTSTVGLENETVAVNLGFAF